MTPGEKTKPVDVLQLLGEALDMELACVLRYKRQYLRASEIRFLQYAHEEQTHARHIAQRIIELGGTPNPYLTGSPTPSHNMRVERLSVMDIMMDDLIATRIAIDTCQQLLLCVGTDDSTTKQLVDDILADKERHAEELLSGMREVALPLRTASGRPAVSTFSKHWPLS
jgi:bacterioferritin